MPNYCDDCGCNVYNGHCVNCHEEVYIYEQHEELGFPIPLTKDFTNKVEQQLVNPQTEKL